jgi:thiamine biosynthesis lipoprotein
LDPRTGRPVDHELRAVTVIAPSAADADALATALLVMGPGNGPAYARERGLAALFIVGGDRGYTRIATAGFERYLSGGGSP